jgi:toxin ParE1/3/4
MAELVWTEPALSDLNEIAEYIALENSAAAKKLVRQVFIAVERLAKHPASDRNPTELESSRYREVIAGPCRIFYRHSNDQVIVLYIVRSERQLRNFLLDGRDDASS